MSHSFDQAYDLDVDSCSCLKASKSQVLFALMVHEVMCASSFMEAETPANIAQLLSKFQDIALTNLPTSLPLNWDIQHTIDLVLGATFLNLLHHKLNPTEHAEL